VAHRERWTHTDELLALTLEKLDELVILTGRAWSDPKKISSRPPKAFRYPRPIAPPKPRRASLDEIRSFFKR